MPHELHIGRDDSGRPLIVVQVAAEPMDAMALLRHLRDSFPNEFAMVANEVPPPEKRLRLCGELN